MAFTEDRTVNYLCKPMLIALLLAAAACAGNDLTSAVSVPVAAGPGSGTSTAPANPAAPVAPSTSIGVGLSGLAFVSDDFRQYKSISDLLANIAANSDGLPGNSPATSRYAYGINENLLELDPMMPFNGHPSVKYKMPGGTAAVPELIVYFPGGKKLTDMWLRITIRFSPGWTTAGTLANYGRGYKLIGWAWDNGNGRASVEFGPDTDVTIGWYVFRPEGNSVADYVFSKTLPPNWRDGTAWYDVVVHYQQTSPTTVREKWWAGPNGGNLVLQGDLSGTMAAGQTVPNVDRVMLGMNFNQIRAADQNQALWFGQWEVVDGAQHANPFGL